MRVFLRFDEKKDLNKIIDFASNVLCRVQDVKTFDGEAYDVFHVDCIKQDGSAVSFDNVLDVMIE